jgi:hypothetical protein
VLRIKEAVWAATNATKTFHSVPLKSNIKTENHES